MNDIAIKVEHLSKYYKLGVIGSGTLHKDIQSKLYKLLGKEDPNKQIGYIESDTDGFWALKDLNFEIKKGDRIGIIGKNGAGKSTLLKMLSQISSPTEGKIFINGKIASLLEVGTGFNPELTGRENIYLNGSILGMKKKEVDNKINDIITFSEIGKHIDTPVKRYSSGMYVRLAFAVAAHLDSDILIADEVLAVGDATFQRKAIEKMNELSTSQNKTILFVSHNMSQIKNLCTKGIGLEKGKLIRFDNNIQDTISWYLGTNNEAENKSLTIPDIKNNILKITKIMLNGADTNMVYISDTSPYLNIIVNGEIYEETIFNMELFFYDKESKRFAYFSPSHFSNGDVINRGKFELNENINLLGLSKGTFYVEFTISEPRGRTLYKSLYPIIINSEGHKTLWNEYHPVEQIGYFVLN